MGNEVREGNELQDDTGPNSKCEAGNATDDRDDGRLRQELMADVDGLGPKGFANSNLAGAFCYCDQHDVHNPDSSQGQREQGDRTKEESHHTEDALSKFGSLECVPYP